MTKLIIGWLLVAIYLPPLFVFIMTGGSDSSPLICGSMLALGIALILSYKKEKKKKEEK